MNPCSATPPLSGLKPDPQHPSLTSLWGGLYARHPHRRYYESLGNNE